MSSDARLLHPAGAEAPAKPFGATLARRFRAVFLTSTLNLLLVCFPAAILARGFGLDDAIVFVLSLLAICPMAERLGFLTEAIADHTSPAVGGLLNASFGNLTELIVSVCAMRQNLLRVVQLSLLGSIFGNLMLVLGCALLAGGLVKKHQTFHAQAASVHVGLTALGVLALALPAALAATGTETETNGASELALSRYAAACLLGTYAALLVFQLKSHADMFDEDETIREDANDPESLDPGSLSRGGSSPALLAAFSSSAAEDERSVASLAPSVESDGESLGGVAWCSLWLSLFTAAVSLMSMYVVDTIDDAAERYSLPGAFIATVVLPVVGNAAEHAAAVMFAVDDRLDLAIAVAVGSASQIITFVLPLMVVVGWVLGVPMDMNLEPYETATTALVVAFVGFILHDGKSTWLKGAVLLVAYALVAGSFFTHKDNALAGGNGHDAGDHARVPPSSGY